RGAAEKSGLCSTYVKIRETDLHILSEVDVSMKARELASRFRLQVERYIDSFPEFAISLVPLPDDMLAPPIIRAMLAAGSMAAVGPMAAVAGAVAEFVCKGLIDEGYNEVIVENGGDIYLQRSTDCIIAVFAGESPLSNRIGLKLVADEMPVGVCTSSGTIGHSLSFGCADSVTVLADSAVVADAAATRIGNDVGSYKNPRDGVQRALDAAAELAGIRGILVICAELMGVCGRVELVPLD
ncbi:MAG: UPF0280 family protein, partial [Desulfocapsaceae bacterium]|nr:UPF0280 family protein [Desulfocapsaceae bacterium]